MLFNNLTQSLLNHMPIIDYSSNNSYIGDNMAKAKPAETVDEEEEEYDNQYSADIEGYNPDDPSAGLYLGENQHYDDRGEADGQGELAVLPQAQNMLAGESPVEEGYQNQQEQEQEDEDEGGDGKVPVQFNLPQTDQFNMRQFLSHIKQMNPEELNEALGKICFLIFSIISIILTFSGIDLGQSLENTIMQSLFQGNRELDSLQQDVSAGSCDDLSTNNVFQVTTKNILKCLIPDYMRVKNEASVFKVNYKVTNFKNIFCIL